MAAPEEPENGRKPDLRFTKQGDRGVSVDRDLSGSGHLARGDRTNMSNLRFSLRAQSRAELDPELLALREHAAREEETQRARMAAKRPYTPPNALSETAQTAPVRETAPPALVPVKTGFVAALARLLFGK